MISTMTEPARPLTPKELAALVGRSARWVREQCRLGTIRTYPVGRPYLIPRREAERMTLLETSSDDCLPSDRNRR